MTEVKVFQFKSKRAKKVKLDKAKLPEQDKKVPVALVPIQGIMPGSKEEMYVAFALDKLKLDYIFQYEIYGGRGVKGGQVLDFYVYTVPLATVLEVYGTYWHRNERTVKDAYDQERVKQYFKGQIDYKILWDIDLQSPDMAYSAVRREILGL